jgi:teichuronic acid biosynthesis glycosyltransferase TuaC
MRNHNKSLVHFRSAEVAEPWLRVLFITSMWPDDERPHYGTFIHTQACSLEDSGVDIDVISIQGYKSPLAYFAARPRILSTVKTGNYDLIHVHTGHAAVVGIPRIGRPSVLSFVGGDVLGNPNQHGTPLGSRLTALFLRQFGRSSTLTITKSKEMEQALPRSVRDRNHVIPNGVSLDAFAPLPRAEARKKLGWDHDEPVVLFLGDPDDPRKNVSLANEAIAEVQNARPDVRLHIGWGTRPSDIPNLMWAADALAFTSRSEGSPNVVKEAMAATLPIVSTPVGDVPERLDGIPGCFVVNPNPRDFAKALELALGFGRTSEARDAVQDLTLAAVANRIAELYEEISGVRRPSKM